MSQAHRQLSPDHIDALMAARHEDPFAVLGPRPVADGLLIRALIPNADTLAAVDPTSGRVLAEFSRLHDDGLFEATIIDGDRTTSYQLQARWDEHEARFEDVYRFGAVISDYDLWLLGEGRHRRPFECLGAHPRIIDGVSGVAFAVWAPGARRVSVVGDFNDWDGRRHPMRFRHGGGIWELFVPQVAQGALYQYEILGANDELQPLKADPYGFAAELRPGKASVVAALPPVAPRMDSDRAAANDRRAPLAIYEVHFGSWQKADEAAGGYLDYATLADRLIPYVKRHGFTHIELMPVSEYPYDGSWGYQPIGLYAPTRRFGSPEGFRAFVDRCHASGIGVLLDWVAAHFPTDAHGLGHFDGTALYEHADPRQGFHRDWNTLIFNYGRNEVRNYLIGNALYWLERYDIDGLRVDAVASMLYLDYSREADDWVPNAEGGNENLDAIAFLRELNHVVGTERPGAIMIAEESTAWPGVTQPPELGGLGFHYKWNMGWMNDSLVYMKREAAHRAYHQNEMTFSLVYAFDENFVLPLSHDEVVHGKGSILSRMPGDDWQQFANLRAYYVFLYTHPGKKLLFMGNEFGQRHEWDYEAGVDWSESKAPAHAGIAELVAELNRLYTGITALHENDCMPDGFSWIDHDDHAQSVWSFCRYDAQGAWVVCVFNMTPVVRADYRIGVPNAAGYAVRLNSDDARYGGSDAGPRHTLASEAVAAHGHSRSIVIDLPPLAGVVLEPKDA